MTGCKPFIFGAAILVAIVFARPALAAPTCGGKRADIVALGSADRTVNGTAGNDVILTGSGDDIIRGKGGNDYICTGPGVDRIFAGAGNDHVWGMGHADHIDGWTGNDVLYGGAQADTIEGGDDIDELYGGAGIDVLKGEDGRDHLDGGPDADRLDGGARNDKLYGGADDDVLKGGVHHDDLYGGDGDDILDGGDHHDILDGGPDEIGDTASWAGAPEGIEADLTTNKATGWGNDELKEIENLSGSAHRDTLRGDDGRNILLGKGGSDFLFGESGHDGLFGGDGDDGLLGGDGDDLLDGGPQDDDDNARIPAGFPERRGVDGGDAAGFRNAVNPITANLVTGKATGQGSDTLTNIEDLGGAFSQRNTLIGDQHVNSLIGGSLADVLIGNGERDELKGRGSTDGGADQLFGDNAYAAIVGSPRGDRLIGGDDRDLFWPGAGTGYIEGGYNDLDYVSFEHLASGVTASLDAGTYSSSGASGTMTGIEQLFGTRYPDTLTGNDEDNRLEGWERADALNGLGGTDYLDGGSVNNDGGSTRDRDPTNGGPGTDECWWGYGNTECESIHSPDP